MSNILVIFGGFQILAWLVGETADSAELHVRNGYPNLLPAWEAGELTAVNVDVPAEDEYRSELYEVIEGEVRRKV